MPTTIEAKELQLMNIFSDAYLFHIPDYQRPYAWTTEQVSELYDDLQYAMGRDIHVSDTQPYFLGSIVIIKDSDSPPAYIVDGQQRITTLTILFTVLRELSTNPEHRASLDKRVRETSDPFAGIEGQFRLNVRKRDRDYFQRNIQTIGGLSDSIEHPPANLPDSQERMLENAEYLWGKLSGLDDAQRNRLATFLVQRCYLVIVATSDQSSAYRIFSVMNDRGLDLSPTDILKAEIIGAMDDSVRTQYTDKWENIEEGVGRDKFREIFAHIRMIYMKDKARGALNDEFRDSVLNRLDSNFIDDVLVPFADTYETVSSASYESSHGADQINRSLTHLGRLDNFDWIPPAMAFFNCNRSDRPLLLQFTRDLERLAYGLFIKRANINERIRRYAQILYSIDRGEDLFGESSPLQLSSSEKSEVLTILDGPVYLQTRVRMPLLLRLDGMLADVGATYAHSIITVEHVLPQNPSSDSEWNIWFADREDREQWTHRLANLVLLSRRRNSRAQNYRFDRKKVEYFQREGAAPFALTSQVLGESEWTPDILERRQCDLIGLIKHVWRLG